MFPIKDNNNNVVRVVIIQDDITDKVMMEETMKRFGQLEALGELSAGIAHDFNNILTGMLLNIEMLEITLLAPLSLNYTAFEETPFSSQIHTLKKENY